MLQTTLKDGFLEETADGCLHSLGATDKDMTLYGYFRRNRSRGDYC